MPWSRCPVRVIAISAGLASPAWALDLPSGVEAEIHEILVEEIGAQNWVRFRLLSPEIDRARVAAPDFELLEKDFAHLCTTFALPYLETHSLEADKIVISISDRPVEFGVSDPDATQYFEQFRVEGGQCVWEGL